MTSPEPWWSAENKETKAKTSCSTEVSGVSVAFSIVRLCVSFALFLCVAASLCVLRLSVFSGVLGSWLESGVSPRSDQDFCLSSETASGKESSVQRFPREVVNLCESVSWMCPEVSSQMELPSTPPHGSTQQPWTHWTLSTWRSSSTLKSLQVFELLTLLQSRDGMVLSKGPPIILKCPPQGGVSSTGCRTLWAHGHEPRSRTHTKTGWKNSHVLSSPLGGQS